MVRLTGPGQRGIDKPSSVTWLDFHDESTSKYVVVMFHPLRALWSVGGRKQPLSRRAGTSTKQLPGCSIGRFVASSVLSAPELNISLTKLPA